MPDAIRVVHAELLDDVSQKLIAALNAELSAMYPEPGANHFKLDLEDTARGRGAFVVVYRGDTSVCLGKELSSDSSPGLQ